MRQERTAIDHTRLGAWATSAAHGDREAAAMLYTWLRPRLLAVALSILHDRDAAEDAVHDAFLIAMTRLHTLREPGTVAGWMRRITQHRCLRMLARPHPVALLDHVLERPEHRGVADLLDAHDDRLLGAALTELPDKLLVTVLLRYFSSSNDYAQLASFLGVPVGTVRSRLHDAKDRMRARFGFAPGDAATADERDWSAFYGNMIPSLHSDEAARRDLLTHLVPDVRLVFTSGLVRQGSGVIATSIDDDRRLGVRYSLNRVFTGGDWTVVDGGNINDPSHPDHCPPRVTLLFKRSGGKAVELHQYDSWST